MSERGLIAGSGYKEGLLMTLDVRAKEAGILLNWVSYWVVWIKVYKRKPLSV